MTLIPLDIPPGARRLGTDLQSSGRWRDVNLVRWRDGSIRPVGGWRDRVTGVVTDTPRAMHTWQDNSADRNMAVASYNQLVHVSASNIVSDITPVGLTAGSEDAIITTGYGGGFYGLDAYGTVRPSTGNYSEATTWSLDNFGEYLVACSVADGKLYEWQLDTGTPAAQIANSPEGCIGLVVTEERFLMALAPGGNPRKLQWCDREQNTVWTPAATNEAGDIELQTSGKIMTGVRVKGQTLILTDNDAHVAVYQGARIAYGVERVGTSCGVASREAVAVVDDGVMWMGENNFFLFTGTDVRQVPCEVADYIFTDINRAQISKAWAVANAQHGEIWFFYPSGSSLEPDHYVSFDYRENVWSFGIMPRTCGVDRGVFDYPMWVNSIASVKEHEVGFNYDTAQVYAETGPISLGNGDDVYTVNKLYPDEGFQGSVTATFKTRLMPNGPETSYGPFDLTNPTDVRFTGRQVRMRIDGAILTDWRVGINRLDAFPRGRR